MEAEGVRTGYATGFEDGGKGPQAKECCQQPLESAKGKKMDSPLDPAPGRNAGLSQLDFNLLKFDSDLWPIDCNSLYGFFLKLFFYLAAPALSCRMWGLSVRCGMWNHFSCSMWPLSCCMWNIVLWPGIEPGTPAFGASNFSDWSPGSPRIVVNYCVLR